MLFFWFFSLCLLPQEENTFSLSFVFIFVLSLFLTMSTLYLTFNSFMILLNVVPWPWLALGSWVLKLRRLISVPAHYDNTHQYQRVAVQSPENGLNLVT